MPTKSGVCAPRWPNDASQRRKLLIDFLKTISATTPALLSLCISISFISLTFLTASG
jgi:hypothetical protein